MRIAIIQMTSTLDPKINLEKIQSFIDQAKQQMDIEAIFLPEVFYSMSNGQEPTPYLIEKNNMHYKNIQRLARDNAVFLLGATASTKDPNGGKIINRNYNFDPDGQELEYYDKMHLFKVDLSLDSGKTTIDESQIYKPGRIPKLLSVKDWKIGLSICFDLRFPELYRHYFLKGANLLTVASAFTVPTGMAHWETLLRARAIENQSYVVACNQYGTHNDKIKTYGHSLVISPWGKVLVDLGEGEGVATIELELSEVEKVRSRLYVKPTLMNLD